MLAYLIVGVVTGIVTSLITRSQTTGQLEEFFDLLRTPVSAEEAANPGYDVLYNAGARDRVIRIGEFQFPVPSTIGVAGFLGAWALVFGLVYGTKWLSTML